MKHQIRPVGILGTGSYLPEKVLTNKDLEKIVDTSDEWITSRTGIQNRRIKADNEATSDLAYEASLKAIESAGITAEDIDMIIVATITPDMQFPATACILQDKLGAVNASAFDLSAACSGFLYGMSLANNFIAMHQHEHILVVGAETLSTILNFEDRNTCVLFGDGAGAVVMGPTEEGKGIKSFELGADGSGAKYLLMPAGGSRQPASVETVKSRLHYIQMAGSDVFKFAVRKMSSASKNVITKADLQTSDIDYLVPHQANIRIISSAAKRLKLPMEKVKVNLDQYGNTSAASIPIALDEAVRDENIKPGDNVVLVGFGGGLTWGSCVIQW